MGKNSKQRSSAEERFWEKNEKVQTVAHAATNAL